MTPADAPASVRIPSSAGASPDAHRDSRIHISAGARILSRTHTCENPFPRLRAGFAIVLGLLLATTAAAQSHITINSSQRIVINGVPSFVIGMNPGPPIDLLTPEGTDGWTELALGGIMAVRGGPGHGKWNAQTEDEFARYMDVAFAHGVRVSPFLAELVEIQKEGMRPRLEAFVRRFKDHPGVMFWKTADEPEWGKVPFGPLTQAAQLVHQLDPNHPVWLAQAPRGTPETLKPYNTTGDITGCDVYPVSVPPGKHSLLPNKGLSMVGDYTRRAVEITRDSQPVFMILQGGWSGIDIKHNPANKLMFPTFREERYMFYQAIINGADAVAVFGMGVGLLGRDEELHFNWTWWRAVLKPLLAEIKSGSELYPVLSGPESKYPLKFTGAPQIEAIGREAGTYLYIFAAAREGPAQEVTFSGLDDGEVTVLFENRTLQTKGSAFNDKFAEHDVHIYRALRKLAPATQPVKRLPAPRPQIPPSGKKP